jgi:transcriptional regulator with XRE-family HTH domain
MTLQLTERVARKIGRFPNRIREYRLKAGLSQLELGRRVGLERSIISDWECGHILPTLPNVFRLAKALDTLAESLYLTMYSGISRKAGIDNAPRE